MDGVVCWDETCALSASQIASTLGLLLLTVLATSILLMTEARAYPSRWQAALQLII